MVMTFVEYCLAHPDEQPDINDWVEGWHKGAGEGLSLHNFLGFSIAEYEVWLKDPSYVRKILASRRFSNTRTR